MKNREGLFNISMKKMTVLAMLLTGLSLLPLLVLGFYNKMCYDDYIFGSVVHAVWESTGSFGQTLAAAAQQANDRYMGWQGCWLVTFLTGIYPANYNYQFAFVVPFLSVGLFVPAVYVAGKQLFTKWMGGDRTQASFVVAVLLFLFYQVMDSPFEGLYWYNGITAYVFPQAFCFFAVAAMTQLLFAPAKSRRVLWMVISAVCTALAAAGNYITALQILILIVLFLLYTCCTEKKKIWYMLVPGIVGAISFLINVLAPGNMVRGTTGGYTPYGPVMAILLSFYHAVLYMIEWTPVIVVLVWIALLPVLWNIAKSSQRNFRYPAIVMLGVYCLLSAMFTPSLYAMGEAGMPRTNNIIQMVYYLCLFGVTTYWLGWLAHRKQAEEIRLGVFLEAAGSRMTVVVLLVVLLVCGFTMDKNTYHSISALRSLVKGEAASFHEESMERYALYQDETIQDVMVEPYSVLPALFAITDLSEDPENWLNQAVADYFSKDSVTVRGGQ